MCTYQYDRYICVFITFHGAPEVSRAIGRGLISGFSARLGEGGRLHGPESRYNVMSGLIAQLKSHMLALTRNTRRGHGLAAMKGDKAYDWLVCTQDGDGAPLGITPDIAQVIAQHRVQVDIICHQNNQTAQINGQMPVSITPTTTLVRVPATTRAVCASCCDFCRD